MLHHQFTPKLRGSVKDVLGPARFRGVSATIFEFTDHYSLMDWGRMPDPLPKKGAALAAVAAHWFERLGRANTWKDFSKSPEALGLRKASRFGSSFNEIGEQLQQQGLKTHYLGVLPEDARTLSGEGGVGVVPAIRLEEVSGPIRHLVVRELSVVPPDSSVVLGKVLADYSASRTATLPRLLPFELVFRFGFVEGSPFMERVKRDPAYLASIGFADFNPQPGHGSDFPVLELFTQFEPLQRPVGLSEALAISGLSALQLQDLLLRSAWVAAALRWFCSQAGLELAEGKMEWALDEAGDLMLADSITPDELKLLRPASQPGLWPGMAAGVPLSKDFLRAYYRTSGWYAEVERAKGRSRVRGGCDRLSAESQHWRKQVSAKPPALPPGHIEAASQVYRVLAQALTGRNWFPEAWSLSQLTENLEKLGKGG